MFRKIRTLSIIAMIFISMLACKKEIKIDSNEPLSEFESILTECQVWRTGIPLNNMGTSFMNNQIDLIYTYKFTNKRSFVMMSFLKNGAQWSNSFGQLGLYKLIVTGNRDSFKGYLHVNVAQSYSDKIWKDNVYNSRYPIFYLKQSDTLPAVINIGKGDQSIDELVNKIGRAHV